LTWATLVALEPQLAGLLAEAQAVRDCDTAPYFCANAAWFGYDGHRGFKPRLRRLVGWDRPDGHPALTSCEAYDLAYQTIYEALPPCRGYCGCVWA
jgi:hypothetical protein